MRGWHKAQSRGPSDSSVDAALWRNACGERGGRYKAIPPQKSKSINNKIREGYLENYCPRHSKQTCPIFHFVCRGNAQNFKQHRDKKSARIGTKTPNLDKSFEEKTLNLMSCTVFHMIQ